MKRVPALGQAAQQFLSRWSASPDPDILIWAERNDRVVVTLDRSTMPVHFFGHLASGRHSPGVVLLRSKSLKAAVSDLETLTYASLPGEWFDQIDYFP